MLEEKQILKPLIINFLGIRNGLVSINKKDKLLSNFKSKIWFCNSKFFINDNQNSIQIVFVGNSLEKFLSHQEIINRDSISGM